LPVPMMTMFMWSFCSPKLAQSPAVVL